MWNICINMSRSNYFFFLFFAYWHLIISGRIKKYQFFDVYCLALWTSKWSICVNFHILEKNLYPLIVWHNILYMTIIVVQLPSRVWFFATPHTVACQASLSLTTSQSLLKLMSIKPVMPSNHLILCRPLLLLSMFPSIRVFSNESVLRIRWQKYWSFSFSISPSSEYSGLVSFRMDWLDQSWWLKHCYLCYSCLSYLYQCSICLICQKLRNVLKSPNIIVNL